MDGMMTTVDGRSGNRASSSSSTSGYEMGDRWERKEQLTGDQRTNDRRISETGESSMATPPPSNSKSQPPTSDKPQQPLKKFFCPCCNIGHATSEDLINHIKEFPIKMETFSCNICMLEFFVKSDLIDHQRLDHQVTTHKTYKCDECDLEYANVSQLNRHKKMHEDIAKKLAACGIILPKPKKSDPMPKETPPGAVFPYRYSQSTTTATTTANQAEKSYPAHIEGDNTAAASKDQPQTKETVVPKEEQAEEKVEEKVEEKTEEKRKEKTKEKSSSASRQKSVKSSKVEEENPTAFYINLGGTEEHGHEDHEDNEESDDAKKAGPVDEDWQEYNSSDFASYSEEDISDDPDYRRKRRRGRPRLSKKTGKQKVVESPLREKRKYVRKAKPSTDGEEQSGAPREKRARREGTRKKRESKPAVPKKPAEEVEEIEAPAHLRNEDGSIQCPDCDVICYSLRGLNRHRKYHFRTMDKMKCVLCDEEFTDKLLMNSHMSREHRLKQSKNADGQDEIRCTEPGCTEVFKTNISLSKHRINVHGIDKSQLHKCEQCGKVYPGSTELRNHRRMHTDERPFTCSICSKAYRSSGGLLWHLKTHSEKKHDVLSKFNEIKVTSSGTYACELCGKEFKSTYGIRIHKENPQKKCSAVPGYWGKWKPKPVICEVCGREFPSKMTLKSHMVTHTGERPHKCRYCEATFKHYKNKFVHEKVHRNQKDFVCNVCGKAFYDGTNLKTHIASHKEIKDLPCQLCGKLFHVEINRRRHEKRCRNFIRCPICSAVFRQHERLMRHFMINHHGAQMPSSDWMTAQPIHNSECSSSDVISRQQTMDNCSNSTFVDSFALFVDHQPPPQVQGQHTGQC